MASRRVLSRALVLSMSAALASLQVLSGVPVVAPTPVARAAGPIYPEFSGGFFGSQAAAAPAGVANLAVTPTTFGQPANPTPATVTSTAGGSLLQGASILRSDLSGSSLASTTLVSLHLERLPVSIPLSTIPLHRTSAPATWDALLASTPLAALPLQNVTWKQVFDLASRPAAVGAITMADVDWSGSVLSDLPLAAFTFGGADITSVSIPLQPGEPATDTSNAQRWCYVLNQAQAGSCANAAALTGQTLIGISIGGAPLKNIPLKNIDFSAAPLKNVPLKNIDLAASGLGALPLDAVPWATAPLGTANLAQFSFAGAPLSSILIASLANAANVVNCATAQATTCATGATLAIAATNHDILSGATLADIGSSGFAGHGTLVDLLTARITGSTVDPLLGDLRLDLAGSTAPVVTIGALLNALSAAQPDPVVFDIDPGLATLGDLGLDQLVSGPAMTLNDLLSELKPGTPDVLLGDLRLDLLTVADSTTVGALLGLMSATAPDVLLGDLRLDTATGVDALVLNAVTGFLLEPATFASYLLGALGTYTDVTGHDITLGELGIWTDNTGADITLGDLAKYLDDSVSLADVLLGLVPPAQFPFENFPIASLGLSAPGRSILKPSPAFMASYGSCSVQGTPIDPSLSVNLPTCRNVRFLNPGGPTPVSSDPTAMDVILPVGASPISVTVTNETGNLGAVPLRVSTDPDGHVRVAFTFPALAAGSLGDFFITFANGLQLGPQSMTTEMRSPAGDLVASEVEGNPDVVDAAEPNAPVEDPGFNVGNPLRSIPVNGNGCSSLSVACTGADPTYIDDLVTGYISSRSDVDWYNLPNVRAGSRISADLTNLPLDADLVLYGPSSIPTPPTLFPASAVGLPGTLVEDPGLGVGRAADSIANQALGDLQLDKGYFSPIIGGGSQVPPLTPLSISQHPGTDPESVGAIAPVSGNYIVAVTGYNGSTSNDPYLLRARVTTPAADASCPARTLLSPLPASAIPTIPAGTNTLFLTNPGRLAATYGQADALAVSTKLDDLVTYLHGAPSLGLVPAVVPLDAYPAVQDTYTAWDANPCSVTAANGVAAQVTGVIHAIQAANPNLAYITIVGGDDIVPMGRVPDLTRVSNEKEYAATFGDTLNPLSAAESASYTLTDDVYGDTSPTALGNGNDLFVPRLAVGRLVETPADIDGQLAAFGSHSGTLDTGTGLVAGYDFLADGARAVAARLAVGGRSVDSTLIDQPGVTGGWTQADLIARLFPTTGATPLVDAINAHYDHTALLPSAGNAGTSGQLETAADVALRSNAGQLIGRILFTMGCHAGLAVPDAYIAGTDAASATLRGDWAQTLSHAGAAVYVANTGYGIGDTSSVAYSERLMALFSKLLDGSLTVGQALAYAKQSYYGSLGAVGVYDVKILQQAAFYGLPFWRVSTATGATPPPAPTAPALPGTIGPDPIPGLQSMPLTISPSFQPVTNSRGTYWVVGDGSSNEDPQVTQYQPILPRTSESVVTPGQTAHGALVTSLVSHDVANVNPVLDTPTIDLSASSPEVKSGDSAWPGRLATITTSQAPYGRAQGLVLVPGQFLGSTSDGTGRQRLFDHLGVSVIYAPDATRDFSSPAILDTTGVAAGTSIAFSVSTSDPDTISTANPAGTVARVLVGYHDFDGTWKFLDLAPQTGTTTWAGNATASHAFVPTDGVEYFVQVVDVAGNVATASNKAAGFTARITDKTPPTITGAVTPLPNPAGWNRGTSALVTFTCTDSGSGIDPDACPTPMAVTTDGIQSVTGSVADRAGNPASTIVTVRFDSTPPTITGDVTPAGWTSAASATVSFTCADAVSGIDGTCPAPVTVVAEGATDVPATIKDVAGNSASTTATVRLDRSAPTITASVSPAPTVFGWNGAPSAKVTFACSDAVSGIPSGGCPAPVIVSTEGVQAVTGTATDRAGNQTSVAATVRLDATAPVVTFTGTRPTFACSTTDALSGVATSAALTSSTVRVGGIPTTTVTCAGATDRAANAAPAITRTFIAPIRFSGFLAPVDGPPIVNVGSAGRTYPIKFQLTDAAGAFISVLPAVTSTTYQAVNCSAFTGTSDPLPTLTAGASGLTYDSTANQFTYTWKTPSTKGCYVFRLGLVDGAGYTADFNLK